LQGGQQRRKLSRKRQEIKIESPVTLAIFLIFAVTALGNVAVAEDTKTPCTSTEYRQFDFWAGDWDVFDIEKSGPAVAHTRVDRILEGCVLREDYQGTDGHRGQSFTIFDHTRKVWHQTWVTNRGELVVIEGRMENGEIVLSGEDYTAGTLVRGRWKPENGNVRESAVTSNDGGRTWKPWFDLMFRPRKQD
jgi:hypothetical protein